MRWLKVALMCALVSSAQAQQPATNPYLIEYAFDQACEISQISCEGLAPPQVGYEFLPPGVWGVYSYTYNPDMVFLSMNFLGEFGDWNSAEVFSMAILIHEIVHYIDHHSNGSMYTTYESGCASEGMAWYVTNIWLERQDYPANWGWRVSYPNCTL